MEVLRKGDPAFGGAKIRRENGSILCEPHARDALVDYEACKQGLVSAIKRKQPHDGSGCALLIYARGYRFQLIDFDISALIKDGLNLAGDTKFAPLWVVDANFFWESD